MHFQDDRISLQQAKQCGLGQPGIDQVSLELGTICKRNGIDFLDPTGLFRAKAKELQKNKKRLYDPINEHWNDDGNKFVGELLADYVKSKYVKH